MKKIIKTSGAPEPIGPYSQAIQIGNFLFCSGQIPLDPKTNQVLSGDISAQTELVIRNIDAVLKEAGCDFKNVVKTTIFLTSMKDFPLVNEVYSRFFKEFPPARSTVEVSGLPKGVNVEIEVVAFKY
ncbi:MAG: RidA family protein [Deltaproteobacteria bacterium]|jgi:2-iminobutanoate/2-iminopropanoate deaminase|nr:RidA family protein [Deltaproteobacteria bacterium]